LLRLRLPHGLLAALLIIQIIAHLAWLPISAHSGQVAIPWMLNQGMTLFDDVIEQHAPGSSLLAALAQRLLPVAPLTAVQLASLALALATTTLVYLLARYLGGGVWPGLAAAGVWFWWEPVYGNVLFYFDTLLGFLLLLAAVIWLIPRWPGWRRALLAGLALGAATLAKQHGWAAALIFGGWLLAFEHRPRELAAYAAGALALPALLVIVMAAQGTLDAYLYWNWGFNFSGLMPNDPLSGDFLRKLLLTNSLAPVFALLALARPAGERRAHLLALALWLAGCATLIPRPGEIHAMGHLPLLAVMSGVALAHMGVYLRRAQADPVSRAGLAGLLAALALGWGWTGAAAYARSFQGTPAHDELRPVAAELKTLAAPGDTLFILPQTDSTPQLHPLSGLLPPGTWVKGWFWYLQAPGVVDTLLAEWQTRPPAFIVYFPDLIAEGEPGIRPLVDFMQAHYLPVAAHPAITFHGPAIIYRYRS
jgi:hypothetical protein